MTITLTRDEAQKMLHYMDDGGDYTDNYGKLIEMLRARLSQCERCGEENPAEIHTCTPNYIDRRQWKFDPMTGEPLVDDWPLYSGLPQEPVAVWELQEGGWDTIADRDWMESLPIGTKLYTAPPQREEGCAECGKKSSDGWALYCVKCSEREWQGLTENEKELLWDEAVEGREHFCSQFGDFADAIEAKLKQKNA
jgi:hypothetical protein